MNQARRSLESSAALKAIRHATMVAKRLTGCYDRSEINAKLRSTSQPGISLKLSVAPQ